MSDGAGQPGRYQRTFGGLIGSMIVIVLVVVGFVSFRGAFRDPEEVGRPDPIDTAEYLRIISDLQDSGFDPVYPPTLPNGWTVTHLGFEPGDRPLYRLNLYTDDDDFIGIRQVDRAASDLIEEHVDASADPGEPLTGVGTVATSWDAWSDDGGDHAYVTELPSGETVLVYGGVSRETLRELVALLTTDPAPVR